ncbi:MAG: mechanosensitive ion channel family protein, partial [Thermodesulfovibrionia bacterium]|nr:mechanosensitive ion channel family protein [Thermodesulfovibrionia bacterium]
GVPRTSIEGFLDATYKGDYERASQYLDLRNLSRGFKKKDGPLLARKLKVIISRTLWIDIELYSDHPRGHSDDGLPSYRDLLGQIETEKKTYTLLLQRVPRGDGVYIWKISNETVAQIPELYKHVGYGAVGEVIIKYLPDIELFGAQLWQWVGLIFLMIAMYVVLLPPTWLVAYIINRKPSEQRTQIVRFMKGPVRFLLWVLIGSAFIDLISPTVTMRAIAKANTLFIIAITWIIIRLFDFYLANLTTKFKQSGRHGAIVLLRPVKTVVRILVFIIALLVWLDNIGFRVTTLMAGLGIGGVAIALAAQAILADLIGAVILFASQPVKIGDFCRFGDKLGTVEDIGLRATRIRTLDNTIVSVPNAEFSKLQLENLTAREKVWFHPRLSLPYETTQEQVRTIILGLENMLRNHPNVHKEPIQVSFIEIGNYSLAIDVFAYVATGNYGEYKKIAEQLNFQIMDIVERAGARLALPSQKMYIETPEDAN